MIQISEAHNTARLVGSKTFTDTGTLQPAALCFYTTDRVNIGDNPLSPEIVRVELKNPSGTVTSAGYELEQSDDPALIMSTGLVLWARLFNREGNASLDFDVRALDDDPGRPGEVVLNSRTLYAGGVLRFISALLT